MSQLTSYIAFWMIMFVLLGAFWYVFDRRVGIKWYRLWFRITHEKGLPENVVCGFIYNRKTQHKAFMAALVSTAQSVVALINLEQPNLLVELILWIVEVPMTLVGFSLGPVAFRLWSRKKEMFDTLDDIETGKVSLTDLLPGSDKEDESANKKEDREDKEKSPPLKPAAAETAEPVASEIESPKKEPEPESENPRDMIKKFTRRHNR